MRYRIFYLKLFQLIDHLKSIELFDSSVTNHRFRIYPVNSNKKIMKRLFRFHYYTLIEKYQRRFLRLSLEKVMKFFRTMQMSMFIRNNFNKKTNLKRRVHLNKNSIQLKWNLYPNFLRNKKIFVSSKQVIEGFYIYKHLSSNTQNISVTMLDSVSIDYLYFTLKNKYFWRNNLVSFLNYYR